MLWGLHHLVTCVRKDSRLYDPCRLPKLLANAGVEYMVMQVRSLPRPTCLGETLTDFVAILDLG